MIKTENFTLRGKDFVHTWSDRGMVIVREDGTEYDDAIDLVRMGHRYVETQVPIEQPEEETIE